MTVDYALPHESRIDVPSLHRPYIVLDVLTSKQLTRLAAYRGTALHPLVYIAELKLPDQQATERPLDMHALLGFLSEATGLATVEIDPLKVDVAAVAEVMSRAFAERHGILALEATEHEVVIATAEPWLSRWQRDLEHAVRRPIRRVIADPRDITRHTNEFYTMARSVQGARNRIQGNPGRLANLEAMLQLGAKGEPDANDQHVVSVVDWLLQYAFEQRASDIHIEPRRQVGNVRLRIDGVLHKVYELPEAVSAAVTSRLKILSRLDVAEKRRPQDGRLQTRTHDGAEIELRLSTYPPRCRNAPKK
jgi:Type II secretory pathway, ATPase PulE/Tfp pilus assembly pathway, ATPase PilB